MKYAFWVSADRDPSPIVWAIAKILAMSSKVSFFGWYRNLNQNLVPGPTHSHCVTIERWPCGDVTRPCKVRKYVGAAAKAFECGKFEITNLDITEPKK